MAETDNCADDRDGMAKDPALFPDIRLRPDRQHPCHPHHPDEQTNESGDQLLLAQHGRHRFANRLLLPLGSHDQES